MVYYRSDSSQYFVRSGRADVVRVEEVRSLRVVVRSVRNRLSFAKRESADEESLLKFFIFVIYLITLFSACKGNLFFAIIALLAPKP